MLGTSLGSIALAAYSYWHGSIWMMYGLTVLRLGRQPPRLARPAALLPALVPRNVFENAVKWRAPAWVRSAAWSGR